MATYDVIVKSSTTTGHIPKKLLFKRWFKFREFLVSTKIMKIKTPQKFQRIRYMHSGDHTHKLKLMSHKNLTSHSLYLTNAIGNHSISKKDIFSQLPAQNPLNQSNLLKIKAN